jgi:Flp pilus assembly protein TadD
MQMKSIFPGNTDRAYRRLLSSVCALFLLGGCMATTDTARVPARIELQEQVGFVITEEARISSNLRDDYDRALALLQRGQTREGIELLESVAATAPLLSAPRIDLGIAYHRSGDLAVAEQHLLQAVDINPGHPVAHNELGIIYRKGGHFAKARASYETALSIYPGYHFARRNLAVLCDLYLGDAGCALENYEAYLRTVPGDDEAEMWIVDIRGRNAQQVTP